MLMRRVDRVQTTHNSKGSAPICPIAALPIHGLSRAPGNVGQCRDDHVSSDRFRACQNAHQCLRPPDQIDRQDPNASESQARQLSLRITPRPYSRVIHAHPPKPHPPRDHLPKSGDPHAPLSGFSRVLCAADRRLQRSGVCYASCCAGTVPNSRNQGRGCLHQSYPEPLGIRGAHDRSVWV